jgi:hypothetical protein
MPKKILKRKKEDIEKIKAVLDKQNKDAEEALPPITRDTGGSIGNLPIKTKAFKNWLDNIRENINPLIGKKYLTAAPEFSTGDKLMDDMEVSDLSGSMDDALTNQAKDFNGDDLESFYIFNDNNDTDPDAPPQVAPKDDMGSEEKFIDINIIENAVREAFADIDGAFDEEVVQNKAEDKLKDYHEDKEYTTKVNLPNIISNYKQNLIERKKEEERKRLK